MKKVFGLIICVITIFACQKKSEDAAESSSSGSAEYQSMNKARTATQATATNSNGITNGTGYVVASSLNEISPLSTSFNAESDCAASGWPATGNFSDAGHALKFLMCSVLKSPDGPDTVRGGFDRIVGLLCAAGDITYDGVARDITFVISTACFSQTFVTTACTYLNGSASNGPCSGTGTVTGHTGVTGVAPASFTKYLTISLLSGAVKYTIAHVTTDSTFAAACIEGLPTDTFTGSESTFSFFIDATNGLLRYEGRFPGTNKRHMRINLQGTINTALEVTNVDGLKFVQGENFSGGGGQIVSVSGTPSAGRRIRTRNTSGFPATWSASSSDDNTCVGESSATCAANTGIVQGADEKFFFVNSSGFTTSKDWFTNNSYLGSVSNTVDMDDLWD